MTLDISTLIITASVTFATEALAGFLQYRLIRNFEGLGLWLVGTLLQAFGFLSMLALLSRPIWLFSLLANPLMIAGQLALSAGIARFLGLEERRWIYPAFFAAFVVSYFAFIAMIESLFVRTVIVAAATAMLALRNGWLLLRRGEGPYRESAVFTGLSFFLYASAQLANMVLTLSQPLLSYDQLGSEPARAINFLAPIVASLLWTFGFVIMVNQRLTGEIKEEKEKLDMVFSLSPEAELLTRFSDGRIVFANSAFLALNGFSKGETAGRTIREIGVIIDDPEWKACIDELHEKGQVDGLEYPFRRKDGSLYQGRMSSRTMPIDGELHVLTVVEDVTERRLADKRIQDLLAEKELILKEVHHRIKNNMSTIHSLLSLQASMTQAPDASEALKDAASRVESMAVLYDRLYRSGGFDELPVVDYLSSLVDAVAGNFPNAHEVRIVKELGDFRLRAKTLQLLGIIVNELVTNSMKYAFVGKRDGVLVVSSAIEDGVASLSVADNGNGMPDSIDTGSNYGFGLVLIDAIAKQLEGTVRIEGGSGTKITLAFRP
jgi:PAS domain S-box-containing protein